MVGESELIPPVPGVQDPLLVEVEQIRVVHPVINAAPAVSLLLRDQISGVFAQKIVLARRAMQESSPSFMQKNAEKGGPMLSLD